MVAYFCLARSFSTCAFRSILARYKVACCVTIVRDYAGMVRMEAALDKLGTTFGDSSSIEGQDASDAKVV